MALLQIVSMFMAFHTRKVRIKAINDSKEIAALVYINSIILIVVAIALLTLRDQHDLFAVILGLAVILASTIFLSLVFIPTVSDKTSNQLINLNGSCSVLITLVTLLLWIILS